MVFERIFHRTGEPRLRCAVVTPIGPGHVETYRECARSVKTAWRKDRGPFTALDLVPIDDSAGRFGRSEARNEAVRKAASAGADWIFFLDADDLMLPGAFGQVSGLVTEYDAIWGLIHSRKFGAPEHHLRLPQILSISRMESLLVFDPFLTLQMGHFVRTKAALATPFDASIDAGEDFDYYLRLWKNYRCVKVPRGLFVARQGQRSQGRRSATAEQWGTAVRSRLARERAMRGLDGASSESLSIKNAAVQELQMFYRAHALADATNCLALSREMPFRGLHRIEVGQARAFEMYSDNDDPVCLSLAWTGEYRFATLRLWQSLARTARTTLDVGSGTGLWGLLAAFTAGPESSIFCFEPLTDKYSRLRTNVEANSAINVVPVPMAVGLANEATTIVSYSLPGFLSSRSIESKEIGQSHARNTSEVTTVSIDEFMRTRGERVDLVRIDLAPLEQQVFSGMASTLSTYRPDVLLEVSSETRVAEIAPLLRRAGYKCFVIDDADNSVTPVTDLPVLREPHELGCWLTARDERNSRSIIEQSGIELASA